jgi:hypothetical protein
VVKDKGTLGDAIMAAFNAGKWDREWVVVTDIITAGSATIVISDADNCSVKLEADASVPRIDLADASINLALVSSVNKSYQILSKSNISPLIALCQVGNGGLFDWTNSFKPLISEFMANPEITRTLENSPAVPTEQKSQLHFSQVK